MNFNPDRYYGSDLNKFIDENCSRSMTAINMDLITFKRRDGHIRIIESKHSKENIPDSQREILAILSRFKCAPGYDFGVFIVRGDEPYDYVEIRDLQLKRDYIIEDKETFIKWLEFKLDLEED